jgi:2Fe-2S ferredoxin
MARITFITPVGQSAEIEATDGSLMEAATRNGVAGIDGDCGGVCSCATCHVHVAPEWMEKVGCAGDLEKSLLELQDGASERSRLACQIKVRPELDGLIVNVVGR